MFNLKSRAGSTNFPHFSRFFIISRYPEFVMFPTKNLKSCGFKSGTFTTNSKAQTTGFLLQNLQIVEHQGIYFMIVCLTHFLMRVFLIHAKHFADTDF